MPQANKYQGPLAGLNVIDFGHYYAGPMAGMLLADQGATVIQVLRPGAAELPKQQFRLLNRNKHLLTLDLKMPEGKAKALSLIENADVVIENFRPGVMKRLGLDYATVKSANPGLIYLSLPGFASTDKERAHIQAWEGVVGAAACMYTEISFVRQPLNFPPLYTSVAQSSVYGAIHGAIAVMAALTARQTHGLGTVIEVPLVDAGLSGFSAQFVTYEPDSQAPAAAAAVGRCEETFCPDDNPAEQTKKLTKGLNKTAPSPLCRLYPCADGRVIFIWGVFIPHVIGILKGLGLYHKVLREGYVNVGPWEVGLGNNLTDLALSPERNQWLTELVAETFLTKTAVEWETILTKARAPFAVVRTREEWLALEPMLKSGVNIKLRGEESTLTVPGRIGDVSGPGGASMDGYREPESITEKQADELIGCRPAETPPRDRVPLRKGDLLCGVKVLDMANIVAGPVASYTLAQYGADVIKLDFPEHQAPALAAFMLEINQGKRNLLADVKVVPGQTLLHKLACWADVVTHNILDDVGQRLGTTHAQLQAVNPDLVTCQLTCMGGTYRGGWESSRPGFDPVAQAESGLMAHFGTDKDPQWHGAMSSADYIGGLGLAFTALVGLYQKRTTGHAGEGRTSLARVCNHYQLPHMIAENGRCDLSVASGQFTLGKCWWQRLYRCADKWIYVETEDARAQVLAETVTGSREADSQSLEAAFAEQPCADWFTVLNAAHIACHPVLSIADIYREGIRRVDNEAADETIEGPLQVLCWDHHPGGSPVTFTAPAWVRVGEEHSYKRLRTAPRFGEHSVEILRSLGYGEHEIAELIKFRVVHEYLAPLGSKDAYSFKPEE